LRLTRAMTVTDPGSCTAVDYCPSCCCCCHSCCRAMSTNSYTSY
jgi:hypothetical protein